MSSAAEAKPGHNLGPLTVPSEANVIASLDAQYPSVKTDLAEIETAAATYPAVIETEEQASALQALIKKAKTTRASCKAWRGLEKKPWDGVAKIIYNFFITPEEKLEKIEDTLGEKLTAWSDKKAEEARLAAEEKARKEREEAERLENERKEREMDALYAEALKELAEYDERKARERAEEETRKAAEAEEKRKAAEAEAKRIEAEKKAAEKAEREKNDENLKSIRRHMKDAEKLNTAMSTEGDEVSDADIQLLDAIVRPGGTVSLLAGPVASSTLLDDDQRREIEGVRIRLNDLRQNIVDRMDSKARKKREKEQKAEADRLAKEAAEREERRKEDEAKAQKAREERERAEKEAEEAKRKAAEAKGELKDAVKNVNETSRDAKEAGRDLTAAEKAAGKADSKATRTEAKAEGLTDADASRHRGDGGTTSSLRGRWTHQITDFDALPADKLWSLIGEDAKSAAVSKWMANNMAEWDKDEVVRDAMSGVIFVREVKAQVV